MAALVCLGISQPVLDLVAQHPAFLSSYGLAGAEILVFCLAIAWMPSLVATLPLILVSIGAPFERGSRLLAGAMLFIAASVLGAGLVSRIVDSLLAWGLGTTVLAGLMLFLYLRSSGARFVVSVVSSVLLVAPVLFLASENVTPRWLSNPAADAATPVRNPEPVILVLFDEMAGWPLMTPDLRVDGERFPHLAALAETSDWYPMTFSAATETRLAVPSLLTSAYVREHQLWQAQECTYLRRLTTSYDLYANEVVTDLAPEAAKGLARVARPQSIPTDLGWLFLHWLFPGSLRHHLPQINDRWFGFKKVATATAEAEVLWSDIQARNRDVTDVTAPRFAAFLDSIQPPGKRPTFIFHHSLLPHSPLRLLPSGQAYSGPNQPHSRSAFRADPWDALIGRARYELQVRAVDRLIGRLVQRLRETQQFDRSWVILTADHGLAFHVGASVRPSTHEHLPTTISVPLLIKRPHQVTGRQIEKYAEIVDVGASLAAALGFELPCDTDGRDLYGNRPERSYGETVFSRVFGYDQGRLDDVRSALRREVSTHRQILGMDPLTPENPLVGGVDETLIASGAVAADAYRLGPYGSLVGQEVPGEVAHSNLVVELQAPAVEFETNAESPFLHAWIYGKLHGSPRHQSVDLAFAVNDRFVATTRTQKKVAEQFFSAIADPALLGSGPARIEAFSVKGSFENPVLQRLHLLDEEGRAQQLTNRRGTEVLRQGGDDGFAALSETANVRRLRSGSELSFVATTVDPRLYFQAPALQSDRIVVEVALTVPAKSELQVWFQTDEAPSFAPARVRIAPLTSGRNQVILEVEAEAFLKPQFRIDPGVGMGPYVVHSLAVWEARAP